MFIVDNEVSIIVSNFSGGKNISHDSRFLKECSSECILG